MGCIQVTLFANFKNVILAQAYNYEVHFIVTYNQNFCECNPSLQLWALTEMKGNAFDLKIIYRRIRM